MECHKGFERCSHEYSMSCSSTLYHSRPMLTAEVGGWALLWKSPFFFQWCGKTGSQKKVHVFRIFDIFHMVNQWVHFWFLSSLDGFLMFFAVFGETRNTGLRRKSTWRITTETILPVPRQRPPLQSPTHPHLKAKVTRVAAKAQATLMPRKTLNLRQNRENTAHLLKSLKPTKPSRVRLDPI